MQQEIFEGMAEESIEGFQLSPQQQRLWKQGDVSAYHAQAAVRVEGPLRAGALKDALDRLVGLHEILRTAFRSLPGMDVPLQIIQEAGAVRWRESDLRELPEAGRPEAVARLAEDEAGEPFVYERGAEVRARLARLDEESHVLLLTLPGLCADAWSLKTVVRQLGELYAETEDDGARAESVVQYADFSEWQYERLRSDDSAGRDFWLGRNLPHDAGARLPGESEAPRGRGFEPRSVRLDLGREVVEAVRGAAAAHEMSAPVVLLACWQSLLWRLTSEPRVRVAVGFDAGKYEDLSESVGLFTNYVPLDYHFEDGFTFSDVVYDLRQSYTDAENWHEYFSPELLRDDSQNGGDAAATPAPAFDYQRLPEAQHAAGLSLSVSGLSACAGPFKLKLSCVEAPDTLRLEFQYDADLYGDAPAARLAAEFAVLLRSALARPGVAVGRLDLLPEDERRQLLAGWNETAAPYAHDRCVHELFAEQAARTPDAEAVVFGDEALSFGELNRRANRLAHHLRGLGVGPEVVVGLLFERSVEMLVGVLAINKAGGAYLPVDPLYPAERIAFMLKDSGARVLLTQTGLAGALPGGDAARVVCLDALDLSASPDAEPSAGATPDNLAYVIYTSGSTGTPKGVMIRHRSVLNLSAALRLAVYAAHGARLRVSVNAPLAFDASVKQLVQLLDGHTLVVIPEEVRRDGAALLEHVRGQRVDVLDVTPPQLRLLLSEGLAGGQEGEGARPGVVLVGGEQIDHALWGALASDAARSYYNVYGPTECTVDSSVCLVEGDAPSIGRPVANAALYVLDRHGEPSPVGVAGELCVGGAGLARGYLKRPALTAEKFIPDPFGAEPGARLYKTGDLARRFEDGRLAYVGRADHQVKVRGFRIELGEIESALLAHGGVREAVVVTREDEPGDTRLVGYVTARPSENSSLVEGRARHRLPNGMAIAHLNRSETDYLYQEIFEEQTYFRHGVELPDDACVFDVGANVGIFTLYVSQHCRNPRVYAFEPIRPVYETLRINAKLYGKNVRAFPYGLSDAEKSEEFTFYPQFSARSGLAAYADAEDEVHVIKQFLRNREAGGESGMGELADAADELLQGVFEGERHVCPLRRLSDVIREEGVERIDLLKVDVQQAELDVLRGIDDADWPKIRQVSMEVHDAPGKPSEGRVRLVRELLERHGFDAAAEQDASLVGTDRYSVYATRRAADAREGDGAAARLRPHGANGGAPNGGASNGDAAVHTAAGESLYQLPNRLQVFHQNRNESEFIYRQIFEDRIYLQHGIKLKAGDCVFDIGANIGLFTLFVYHWCGQAKVYSFEPIPSTYEKLRSNVALYGLGAKLFNCGLSDRHGEATFTFYPRWSASSGAYADAEEEASALRTFLENQGELVAEYADQLIEGRYEGERVVCPLRTVSEIIREEGVERIDLLKLDAEKSEEDVLEGIEEADWPKIRQIVIEVHDIGGRLARIESRLAREGFAVETTQDRSLAGSNIYGLYARRPEAEERDASAAAEEGFGGSLAGVAHGDGEPLTAAALRAFLREKLPEYMIPSALVVLEELPLTAHGKVDRKALPAPELTGEAGARHVTPARTPVEEILAGIWAEVLKLERVGAEENFFELGGHSLLATQLISRVRSAFKLEIPLRSLFERPTVADLAVRVEAALAAKEGVEAPPVTPAPRDEPPPLSFAQQRLWFIDQMEPGSSLYNTPKVMRLTGSLDVAALGYTLNEIVRRHEVLRTTFAAVEGSPVQLIHPPEPVPLPVIDLRELPGREGEARRLIDAEIWRPFDLANGPLLRARLLKLDEQEHVVLFTTHHIVSDGWSLSVLVEEVAALYQSRLAGRPSPLAELPIQYADFAIWQRGWLRGEVLERELDYWRRQLAGAPALLELPTDRPRSAVQMHRGAHLSFELSAELSASLRELSRREGATLFMTLLAAWQLLLSRYSGQEDVVVGTPIANRNRAETEGLIGFFVNTLALRADLSGSPSFRELVGRVREVCLGAYAHQDVPFEKIVEEVQPERSLSHAPLFQVMFALQSAAVTALELPGLRLSPVKGELTSTKFDMTLNMVEFGESIAGSLDFDVELFDAATVERLITHFKTLLEGAAADPQRRADTLPILPPEERSRILVEWNDVRAEFPAHASIHQIFGAQAARTPDAVAVVHGERQLSYLELDRRANQVARRLRRMGVGAESLVGVMVERSVEHVAVLLGVLKAGAGYVPLDPDYPAERLRYMVEDARVRVVVADAAHAARWGDEGLAVLGVDADWRGFAEEPTEALPPDAAGGDNLAYVIYTSGSTGTPKGVAVTHRAVLRLVVNTDYVRLDPSDTVAQLANASFDAATFELWGPLLHGARVLVIPRQTALSPPELTRVIADAPVTTLFLTTALFNQMAAQSPAAFAPLRHLLFGGEQVDPRSVAAVLAAGAPGRLLHVYGPTETTTFASWHEVRGVEAGAGAVPIGRPLANTELYVLDSRMEPAPVGVEGEVYVGGPGLARGYLGRAGLTAERFVPHPHSPKGGERLYRTGDVGRWTQRGELVFVGRRDGQVKVRGFRVEVGEVESALSSHPEVRQCAVVAREEGGGEGRRLVAYVAGASAAELRAYLSGRLPEYMVPSAFVELEELPLTANGKVDRRALPEPAGWGVDGGAEYVAPRSPAEEMVAGVWAEVLKVGRVGAHDDFFALGGHSLLATQVASRVRQVFNVEMPLRELFEHPTVARFAARVEEALRAGEGQTAPALGRAVRETAPPLSFAQQRLWFIDQLQPGIVLYSMPFSIRLVGALDVDALRQTLTEIVRRHEVLRTTFAVEDGMPVQLIHEARPFDLPLVDLREVEEGERAEQARRLSAEEAQRKFDLSAGPLLRAKLLRLGGEEHVALLNMHHIVSDGWSMGVLVREVVALYGAYSEGRPTPLAELPIQYADFAVWQRGWLQGEVLERELDYWRRQLAGAPAVLELPTDRPRAAVQTFRGAYHQFRIPQGLWSRLHELSRREGATLFMTLLAGWQLLLSRYSGQEDVVVGTPIANRNRAETEDLIGFFVNNLVLRTDLSGSPSFQELLKRVREVALGAYAHQDLPFEKLVEELQPERSLTHAPLFQVTFALQNAPQEALQLAGLELYPAEQQQGMAKSDLSLMMMETNEEILGVLVYSTDLFEAETVERMGRHFTRLLEAVAADSAREVSAVPLLSEAEREEMLAGWNRTGREYPEGSRVEELFERQARLSPEAVAVECGGESVSYAELDERAGRLARRLRGLGVAAESRVGVCLPRSPELIVALLGILKAGGVYVPLDPQYPRERLTLMMQDAAVSVTVTNEAHLDALPTDSGPTICLGVEWEAEPEAESERVESEKGATIPGGEGLAYVMYTSGSTGRPKGVCVTHRAISRLVVNTDYVQLDPTDRVAQVSNPSFDAATFEIWGALLNGGRVVVLDREATLSPRELAARLRERGVTAMFLTTALFNQVVGEEPGALATLRHVLFGGEAVDAGRVRECLEGGAPGRLLHVYGPTENTTFTTWQLVEEVERGARVVPIGRGIANTRVYVLDARMEPVPPGVTGELYTGGDGLARGYLNDASMTAERFVPDPYASEGGGRLYRTGDLARWTQRGELEFVGRRDGQVKLRGFRVEVGEVEATLNGHGGVRESAVVARDEAGGSKRLVAFFVPADHANPPAPAELRAHILSSLPEYMVPAAFVALAALPLNSNGKIDRAALPETEGEGAALSGEYVPARTATEELLCGLWAELLKVERVGALDNFFELGGHSLLATQVVSRVRETFGVEVPLRELFDRQTVAGLALAVDEAMRAGAGLLAPSVLPAAREGALPLSFAQQRLWFIDQLQPGLAIYNMPFPVRLKGSLNVRALEQTLDEVVRRHEVLRTTFAAAGGEPVQVIHPPRAVTLPLEDLSRLPEAEREAAAQKLVGEEARRPFDLSAGPLLRVSLLRLGEDEHVVLLTMHHIVSDGWSLGILVKEVAALYEAYNGDGPAPLPELKVQYADYAVWQREWLRGEALERHMQYWRERMGGAPSVLELPTDRPRPAVQTFRGTSHAFMLPAGLTRSLRGLSQREGATLFMTLLAGWQLLLSRYSGQEDVVVGTPIANRNRAEVEPLIGFFVNTLALRTRLEPGLSFRELLGRVREVTLGAYAHQDLPFEKLVEELQPERSLSHAPIFQVFFALQNAPVGDLKLAGLELSPAGKRGGEERALFDLALSITESGDQLSCGLGYNSDLFDAATVERMAAHYGRLLEQAAAAPDRAVSELELLGDEEREQLRRWGRCDREFPRRGCVHQLVEQQAGARAGQVAVSAGGAALTYGELDAAANRLARHLLGAGLSTGQAVGVLLERSAESVVAMLAVWKAGGVYLPLDPRQPRARLDFMLADAGARAVITRGEAGAWLREAGQERAFEVIDLDAGREGIAAQPPHAVGVEVDDAQAAYVIYTSGSTGEPKGVVVEHRQLLNTLDGAQELYRFTDADVVPFLAPFTFDISLFEVLCPLLAGARLVLADAQDVLQPEAAAALLSEATFMHAVPGLMRHLAAVGAERRPAGGDYARLRGLFVGGDVVAPELVKAMRESFPHADVWVGYGPTEATIMCALYRVGDDEEVRHQLVGRPMANVRLRLLDAQGHDVSVGVAGEIHIGGAGVARGYLNREELTAERFVTLDGERYYRSGDLGRWLPDGTIEFAGRRDEQVKVRGFRVEPGEVEAALARHAGVRHCVVEARADAGGGKRLVAYFVPAEGEAPSASELREHLGGSLPDYMIPSAFVALDEMPLTSNAKIDRKALPDPEAYGILRGREYVPARTATEEALAGIWAGLLKVERVGAHDNFFELGGHSLLATQLVSRVRETFGVEVPLRELFQRPTLAELAMSVDVALRAGQGAQAPPLVPVSRERALPLSFAQQRLWFIDQLEPGGSFYNMPVALRLTGRLDVAALEATFTEIVRRHESLRTTFVLADEEPVQVISPPRRLPVPVISLEGLPREAAEAEARRLASEEAARPFDLERGPMLRAAVIRLGADEQVLLFTMHHIVSDGWSMGVLVREIVKLYGALSEGREAVLDDLKIQYPDFAVWQREWLQGEVLERELGYWRQQLAGAPALLELPTDRPRPAVQTQRGASHSFTLPRQLSHDLQELSRREGVTLFMTLLAGWQLLLARYSGQEDVVVGTPIANRNRAETEDLIGFFVNTLVLRTDTSGSPSFRELVGRVREVALGAYAHQDLPFEKLVEELQPERSLSHTPIFQVMFVLQNAPSEGFELPGLKFSPLGGGPRASVEKYDLTLTMQEDGGDISATFSYNADLFLPATIERMQTHFARLLEGAAADPDRRASALPMLSEAERRQSLVEWNSTRRDFPRGLCLHQLFEAQAGRTPDAAALVLGEARMTYGELEARSNQLARYLKGLGVGPETLVGMLVESSFEMVVGLLGVLKAGGAYVPLDPQHPAERLSMMAGELNAPLLLTQGALGERLAGGGVELFRLDADWAKVGGLSEGRVASGVAEQNPAYVIYTSGSTGQPKGVVVTHASACDDMFWMSGYLGLGAEDSILQLTSFSFDPSVGEFFTPLMTGGRVVLPGPRAWDDASQLVKLLLDEEVSILSTVPSQLVMLSEEPRLRDCLKVRAVITGGEVLTVELKERVMSLLPGAELHNLYGPTEATINVSAWRCERGGDETTVPLGRPTANTQLYLLDRNLEPVPVGVAAELYIGGAGLARGYLKRPALTAERFVPHPFAERGGERLYRSGDLARYGPDGRVEFLGRLDHQVKLRGFRIELGEIEAALRTFEGVRQCVVVPHGEGEARRLVAYLVTGGAEPATDDLRRHLMARLPGYMIPAAFVFIDELPLLPNGKVDYRGLPRPGRPAGGDGFVAPRDLIELQVAQIWEEVLGVESVGARDNFFDLGGHSILAARLMSRIERVFGVKLPLVALFKSPTVEHLASLLRRPGLEAEQFSELVEIQPGVVGRRPIFCAHPTGGNVLCYAELARQLGPEQPFYAFQSRGLDPTRQPHASVKEMAAAYVEKLRAVQPEGPYRLGGWSVGGVVAYEMAQQLTAQGQQVEMLFLFDAPPPPRRGKMRSVVRPLAQLWSMEDDGDPLMPLYGFGQELGLNIRRLALDRDQLVKLQPDEQITFVMEHAREAGLLPPGFDEEQFKNLFRVFRHNLDAFRTYAAKPYAGRVTLFISDERLIQGGGGANPISGWEKLTRGGFEKVVVPGGHFVMLRRPHVKTLAEKLGPYLEAEPGAPPPTRGAAPDAQAPTSS